MKMRTFFGPLSLTCCVALSSTATANDECVDATVIDPNSATSFNTGLATDSGDQHDGSLCDGTFYTGTGADVWMVVTLLGVVTLNLSTCSAGSYDTELALYAGGDCAAFTVIACNGDSSGEAGCQSFYSALSYEATAGTYHIRIGGYEGATGEGTLTCSFDSLTDCDNDGIPDNEEPDCDSDGLPDDCENDCNSNGTPDDCEKGGSDCNANGVLDSCDIADGSSSDLNSNGTPDECEADSVTADFSLVDAIGGECIPDGPLSVAMTGVVIGAQVDMVFTNGGDATWPADVLLCMENPDGTGCVQLGGFNIDCASGCSNQSSFPTSWNVPTSGKYSVYIPLADFGFQGAGDYTFDLCHGYQQGSTPTTWVGTVTYFYLPDAIVDCNENGVADDVDISEGTSEDCDFNGQPDECQVFDDCDMDGTPDVCQTEGDCDGDGIPDVCEDLVDCNSNGIFDACETDNDCNGNSIPDDCETLADCNENGTPDACETFDDCDANGVPDECDLASGGDLDNNGVVDACEGPIADNCADAAMIDPNSVTFFNNNGATASGIVDDDTLCPDTFYTNAEPDVWHSMSLDVAGNLVLSTCSAGSFDTDMSLWMGTTCADLTQVACSGDATADAACQDFHSVISYAAEAGMYWVRIGGFNGAEGAGFLTSTFDGEPVSCEGDFNSDNDVDGADLGIALSSWGTANNDLNEDGIFDGSDMGLFLSLWGPCDP